MLEIPSTSLSDAWDLFMSDFPNVRIGQVRKRFSALRDDQGEDGASYRAVRALYFADWGKAEGFISSIPTTSTHAPSLRIKAYYHLHEGDVKSACTALARAASDDWAIAELQTWRRRDALGTRRSSPFVPSAFLSIFAALKDEAEYLEEWLAYHSLVGVERFYLYENNSTDSTREVIERAKKFYDIRSYSFTGQPAQDIAMSHFIEAHRHETEWAALIDADEFIRPLHGFEDVRIILEGMNENVSCVALSWLLFGSGGHIDTPAGLCVEAFTSRRRRAVRKVKSIVRMSRVASPLNTHQMLVAGRTVDAQGDPVFLLKGEMRPHNSVPLLALNHYVIKSQAQYRAKVTRGRSGRDAKPYDSQFFDDYDHNSFEDYTLAAFAEQIAEIVAYARRCWHADQSD